jgi:hypothetical protein
MWVQFLDRRLELVYITLLFAQDVRADVRKENYYD